MLNWLCYCLLLLFTADRWLKHTAVVRFFGRPQPAQPATWPAITLIQPVTHSPNDLQAVLASRARLAYPGSVQHILVCDSHDQSSLEVVAQVCRQFPGWQPAVLAVQQPGSAIASKLYKMDAALAVASGEVVCFVDDDILLPPDGLQILTSYLAQPGVGAVFGLACYIHWGNAWSGLMSAFVNSNALLAYIPFTFLIEPFTVTGHCYALRRQVFESAGGLNGMQERLDDDHEIARRIRSVGLRLCQTPLVYQVDNTLPTWHSYQAQMKRWFVFPRQMMLPYMSRTEQTISLLGTLGSLIPGGLAVLAVVSWQPGAWAALAASLGMFSLVYWLEARQFLRQSTPLCRWPLLWVSALLAPFQALWAMASNNEIEWRGQRLRIQRGGRFKQL